MGNGQAKPSKAAETDVGDVADAMRKTTLADPPKADPESDAGSDPTATAASASAVTREDAPDPSEREPQRAGGKKTYLPREKRSGSLWSRRWLFFASSGSGGLVVEALEEDRASSLSASEVLGDAGGDTLLVSGVFVTVVGDGWRSLLEPLRRFQKVDERMVGARGDGVCLLLSQIIRLGGAEAGDDFCWRRISDVASTWDIPFTVGLSGLRL